MPFGLRRRNFAPLLALLVPPVAKGEQFMRQSSTIWLSAVAWVSSVTAALLIPHLALAAPPSIHFLALLDTTSACGCSLTTIRRARPAPFSWPVWPCSLWPRLRPPVRQMSHLQPLQR